MIYHEFREVSPTSEQDLITLKSWHTYQASDNFKDFFFKKLEDPPWGFENEFENWAIINLENYWYWSVTKNGLELFFKEEEDLVKFIIKFL